MNDQRLSHLALLVADAERSLEGLSHSLGLGAEGLAQGALHVRDLAASLAGMGLAAEAALVDDVARRLALGEPAVLPMVQELVTLVQLSLSEVMHGQSVDPTVTHQRLMPLTDWVHKSAAVEGSSPAAWPESASADMVQAAPSWPTALTSPHWNDTAFVLERQALSLLQQARMANHQDDERSVRLMDTLLSEIQDWMARLRQQPLSTVFDGPEDDVRDLGADPEVLQALRSVVACGPKPRRVRAHLRGLTLYIDVWWLQVPADDHIHALAGQVAQAEGSVHPGEGPDDPWRLVVPASAHRQRVVPYLLHGLRYVAPWSQVVSSDSQSLIVRRGLQDQPLRPDRILPAENMNVFDIPSAVTCPGWLRGIALDGMGEVYCRAQA